MDSIGRLNMIKLAAIPSALGWVLIATATNVPMLLTGRVLTGIASGNKYLIEKFNVLNH